MKISGPGSIGRASVRKSKKSAAGGGGGFKTHLGDGEDTRVSNVSAPATLAPVDALLSLQEVPDALTGRRAMVNRGFKVLDHLDEIRIGLLEGGIPRHSLRNLLREVRSQRHSVDDPRLVSVLDEIELRARVELAKYGKNG